MAILNYINYASATAAIVATIIVRVLYHGISFKPTRESFLLKKLVRPVCRGQLLLRQYLFWPTVYLARVLYAFQRQDPLLRIFKLDPVTVVCISDTHNTYPEVPDGYVLVHAGDLSKSGTFEQIQETLTWLNSLPHEHKIVVAGNHDILLDPTLDIQNPNIDAESLRAKLNWGNIIYLQDTATDITCSNGRKLKIYGSPKSKDFGSPNQAFQYPASQDVWHRSIPSRADILVTHCPPRAHLDILSVGCNYLLKELWRARPRLHVFGHCHDGHGTQQLPFDDFQNNYEQIVINNGGIRRLLWMFEDLVRSWRKHQPGPPLPWTHLVNAASADGFFHKRKPVIKVVI
ncbi:metallophosphoesterase domain-containing protein [Pochonia chlamydosporia 170]|uniref:Metallophosphoesterase domain-containing protein n=1 Tax=Pochonia chlamydosporia 170 TaxID=1380566 RepID=A0A179G6C3_METCM|nr:metallophosphoesterase domain-containing protein [Pochonia chlamydosporia 170]OAQ73058.1 metallophosphoesterase domain-containing protein [Pochonia chlamydosporia 170]